MFGFCPKNQQRRQHHYERKMDSGELVTLLAEHTKAVYFVGAASVTGWGYIVADAVLSGGTYESSTILPFNNHGGARRSDAPLDR
jgi:hypothetical protein